MRNLAFAVMVVSGCVLACGSDAAKPPREALPKGRPGLLAKLVECRAIADNAARLSCFDERVAAFDAAEKNRDVVVVDREQVREARKSLFGLSLPSLKIFGGDGKDDGAADDKHARRATEEDIKELDTTIARATYAGDHWVFVLADGARWMQTDNGMLLKEPKPGDPIHIKKGAMGSFLANVNKQIAIRVQRIN